MSEKAWQKVVTDYAELRRFSWFHNADSRRTQAGVPDLMLVRPGSPLIFLELKAENGRLSERQKVVITELRASGVIAEVFRPSGWTALRALLDLHSHGLRHDYQTYVAGLCACVTCRTAGEQYRADWFPLPAGA